MLAHAMLVMRKVFVPSIRTVQPLEKVAIGMDLPRFAPYIDKEDSESQNLLL